MKFKVQDKKCCYWIELDSFINNEWSQIKKRFRGISIIFWNVDSYVWSEVKQALQCEIDNLEEQCKNNDRLQWTLENKPDERFVKQMFRRLGDDPNDEDAVQKCLKAKMRSWEKDVKTYKCYTQLEFVKDLLSEWEYGQWKSYKKICEIE